MINNVMVNLISYELVFLGLLGLLVYKKNLILILISLEVLFLGININFILSALFLDDIIGYIFNLFILSVAGSEISIGLALTIVLYRIRGNIFSDNLNILKS